MLARDLIDVNDLSEHRLPTVDLCVPKLLSIRSDHRTKAVVDAELYGGDGLFDVDP